MASAAAVLHRMATVLLDGLSTGDHLLEPTGSLVRLSPPDEQGDAELGIRDLEGVHPTTALLGFTAPDDWWALGVMGSGWAAPFDEGDSHESARGRWAERRPSEHPDRVRVASVLLVARDGSTAGGTRIADGRSIDEPSAVGTVPDALRRALGLPTPPPGVPVAELFVAIWLLLVNLAGRQAQRDGRRLTWSRLIKLLPVPPAELPRRHLADPTELAPAVLATAAGLDWPDVRAWATRGSLPGLVTPDLATWMDEGMLCRWLLGGLPPLGEQLRDARPYLRRDAARFLGETVDLLLVDGAGAGTGDAA